MLGVNQCGRFKVSMTFFKAKEMNENMIWTRPYYMLHTRTPKYDLVILSRTKYGVVLGRTEYEYDRKNVNLVRVSTRYDHFN